MKSKLQKALYQAAVKVVGRRALKPEEVVLSRPIQPDHGDYAASFALRVKTEQYPTPWDLANAVVNTWRSQGMPEALAKIEVKKPGFINLWLKKEALASQIDRVLKEKAKYGRQNLGNQKKMMFEYSHPNTHKLFHIGHLRTTLLGESLCRLYEFSGFKVVRANYQGDVGLHIAKCFYGLSKTKAKTPLKTDERMAFLAKAYVKGTTAYEQDEKAKKEINHLNALIYAIVQKNGPSKEALAIKKLWQQTRQWSLAYFAEIYQKLDVRFDRYYFESEVTQKGKEMVWAGLKKKIFVKSQGAVVFPGEKVGLHTRVFLNQFGLPTYEAKDMALAKLQFAEFKPDCCVHVVGPEQKSYFAVVFKALEKIVPPTKGKEKHLSYGWVRLKKSKMASRAGRVVEINWLITAVAKEVAKIIKESRALKKKEKEELAMAVALGAVKYAVLKYGLDSEIQFDIKESIDLAGNSGPYLQYTFARCQSVLAKAENWRPQSKNWEKLISSEEEMTLLRALYQFPEVIEAAVQGFAPNLIANFLFDLAQKYNLFYHQQPILRAGAPNLVNFRLSLTAAVAQVLKNGLTLLGIACPERM